MLDTGEPSIKPTEVKASGSQPTREAIRLGLMPEGDVNLRTKVIETSFDALNMTPIADDESRNLDNDQGQFLNALLQDVASGKKDPSETAILLNKQRTVDLKRADLDRLVEGLNPEAIMMALEAAIDSLDKDEAIDVYFTDLAKFKAINDSVGQQGGDRVIAEAGRRLLKTFMDAVPDVRGGRLGGDEFLFFRKVKVRDPQLAYKEIQKLANTEQEIPEGDLPPKLFDVKTREGVKPIYLHVGLQRYDRELDQLRELKKEEEANLAGSKDQIMKELLQKTSRPSSDTLSSDVLDPENEPQIITPGLSVVMRANESLKTAKESLRTNHPELASNR